MTAKIEFRTAAEVADTLGVSRAALYRAATKRGKIGRYTLLRREVRSADRRRRYLFAAVPAHRIADAWRAALAEGVDVVARRLELTHHEFTAALRSGDAGLYARLLAG